ncbi:MAG TPA: hypothetical protein VM029_03455, partial [Opitutaceae bacterium]|nr:hypothetical protein [Opitutaceae bacterium]
MSSFVANPCAPWHGVRPFVASVAALLALSLSAQNNNDGFQRDSAPTASPMPRTPRAYICFPPFPATLDQPVNRNLPAA